MGLNEIFNLVLHLITNYWILLSFLILSVYIFTAIRIWVTYKPSPELNILFNQNPKVTVILPAFNEEISIVDSVLSVKNQDYENIEIIVVNDGSTDRTEELMIEAFDMQRSDHMLSLFNKKKKDLHIEWLVNKCEEEIKLLRKQKTEIFYSFLDEEITKNEYDEKCLGLDERILFLRQSLNDKIRIIERFPDKKFFHTSKIKSIYITYDNSIILINTVNGGKSSALNNGILYTNNEYILNMDADTILVKDAISKTLRYMRPDADALSCFIGVINGNKIVDGELQSYSVPKKILPRIQWFEYVRSFLLWRTANDKQNATLVMPGAYSFFKREILIKIGGYKHGYLSEDMELTMDIIHSGGKIQFLSKFLAWTEVPENLSSLTKQRLRWYRGGLQSLLKYKDFIFNTKYNPFISFYMIPFLWVADVIGIWVEVFAILQIVLYFIFDFPIDWNLFVYSFIILGIMYYIAMTLLVLFLKYRIMDDVKKIKLRRTIPIILLEIFTYHYLNLYWMVVSHTKEYLGRESKWGKFSRKGFNH